MAEVIFPAVPFNGGTVNMNESTSNMCKMDENGRFVSVFQQTSPSAVIATVVQVTNPKTTTPTVTVVRQQVLNEISVPVLGATYVQVFKLASDRILVAYQTTIWNFDVYSIDSQTGVLTKRNTNTVTLAPGSFSSATAPNGNGTIFTLQDDCIVYFSPNNTSYTLGRFEFNNATNVLSHTAYEAPTFASTSGFNVGYSKIVGSTNEAFIFVASGGTSALGYAQVARVIKVTPTTHTTKVSTPAPTPFYSRSGVSIGGDKCVFTDGSMFCEYDFATNTISKPSTFQGVSDVGSNHISTYCIPVNSDYFIVTSRPVSAITAGSFLNPTTIQLRVIKYTDFNYAQASPGTANNTKGLTIPTLFRWFNGKSSVEMWGSDVIVQMGLKSAKEFTIRTVWF